MVMEAHNIVGTTEDLLPADRSDAAPLFPDAGASTAAIAGSRHHRHHRKRDRKHGHRARTPDNESPEGGTSGEKGSNAALLKFPRQSPLSLQNALQGGLQAASEELTRIREVQHADSDSNSSGAVPPSDAALYYLPVVLAVAVLLLVVALQLSFGGDSTLQSMESLRQPFHECATQACRYYAQLFAQAMNRSAPVCDNFYAHVCGRWDSSSIQTSQGSVLFESWSQLAKRAASKLSLIHVPSDNLEPVHRAARFIRTCLAVLDGTKIYDVKSVLDEGNITWPYRREPPDFLDTLFYMARRVFRPVLYNVATLVTNPGADLFSQRVALAFTISRPFQVHLEALTKLAKAGHLHSHLRSTYEMLAGAANESRLKELAAQFANLADFLQRSQRASHITKSSNATFFLQYTPSVSRTRWDRLIRRHLGACLVDDDSNQTICSKLQGGVHIEDADYFAALFDIHARYGEQVMDDIVQGLCVQSLVEYASFELLASLRGSRALATRSIYDRCFSDAYVFYDSAINAYFHQPLSPEVTKLNNVATAIYDNFVRSRPVFGTEGYDCLYRSKLKFQLAWSAIDRLSPTAFSELYDGYPEVTDNALINWMQHKAFAVALFLNETERASVDNCTDALTSTGIASDDAWRSAGAFRHFRMGLIHMEEPFYVSNASEAVLMAGVGTRVAAAVFYDYVDYAEEIANSTKVYARNHDCLFPGAVDSVSPDLEIQGAVASVSHAWYAFQARVRSNSSHQADSDNVAFLKRDEAFFVFFCYVFCGYPDGQRMCNVPLQHSPDFSRVFGCKNGSLMNPARKCRMIG